MISQTPEPVLGCSHTGSMIDRYGHRSFGDEQRYRVDTEHNIHECREAGIASKGFSNGLIDTLRTCGYYEHICICIPLCIIDGMEKAIKSSLANGTGI